MLVISVMDLLMKDIFSAQTFLDQNIYLLEYNNERVIGSPSDAGRKISGYGRRFD